jgi:hypothetical protein
MDRKTAPELQEHMLGTYHSLRVGLVVLGVALPLLVLLASHVVQQDPTWHGSISAYYHGHVRVRVFTTRDVFVGGLLAIAACLYFYKGYGTRENVALNLAGVLALVVALCPTHRPGTARDWAALVHKGSAVLFFLCIAYVSLRRSGDTVDLLPESKRPWYRRLYAGTGVAMIVMPLSALAIHTWIGSGTRTFWVEASGVWAFAAYWFVKTLEMRESHAEQQALDGQLEREAVAAPTAAVDHAAVDRAAVAEKATVGPPGRGGRRRLASRTVERVVPARAPAAPRLPALP